MPLSQLCDTTEIVEQMSQYSMTVQLLITKLPAKGVHAAILAVKPPPKGRQRPKATIYLTSTGELVHEEVEAGAEAEDTESGAGAEAEAPAVEAREEHPGINCDGCGMKPIIGPCWRKVTDADTEDYCQACYDKLGEDKKAELNQVEGQTVTTPSEELAAMAGFGEDECDNMKKLRMSNSQASRGAGTISPNTWHCLIVNVDAEAGTLEAYLDNELALRAQDLAAEDLWLRSKIQLFGGALEANHRGGNVRRLAVYNRLLTRSEIKGATLESEMSLLEDAAPPYSPPVEEEPERVVDDYYYDY